MTSFADIWGGKSSLKLGLKDRVKLAVRGKANLKKKISEALVNLRQCVRKLTAKIGEFNALRKAAMEEAKKAFAEGDEERAKMFTNEAVFVGRLGRTLSYLKFCLELIMNRLAMALMIGDALATVEPLKRLIRIVAPLINSVMPSMGRDMSFLQEALEQLEEITNMTAGPMVPTELTSKEAADLYEAIKLSAEKDLELALPDLLNGQARKVKSS